MKKIFTSLLIALLFIGCSSKAVDENITPKLVVNKSLNALSLNDQNDNTHKVSTTTKTIVFAFSKDGAHTCNDYFVSKSPSYLADNNTLFVADVSAAPSLIRSMFIMPGLRDFKHTVLILDSKEKAAPFRAKLDTEKIIIVSLDNFKITAIKTITSKDELIKAIESK